jgi:hypothetical protein
MVEAQVVPLGKAIAVAEVVVVAQAGVAVREVQALQENTLATETVESELKIL